MFLSARIAALSLMLAPALAAAAAPLRFHEQGRLLDAQGAPVEGTHALTVTLAQAGTGAVAWAQTFSGIPFHDGFFAVTLTGTGSNGASLDDVFAAEPGALEVRFAVDGVAMGPAHPLHHAPVAAVAARAGGVLTDGAVAPCDATAVGALRWDQGVDGLRVCDGSAWRTLGYVDTGEGDSQQNAGRSCAAIRADYPLSPDGIYWVDADGGAHTDAVQAWCDMQGGGYTVLPGCRELFLAGLTGLSGAPEGAPGVVGDGTYRVDPDGVLDGVGVGSATCVDMASRGWTVRTFDHTGAQQAFTTPPGVTSLRAVMWGAAGGTNQATANNGVDPGVGGGGGYTEGTLSTTAGEAFVVTVGGCGRQNSSYTNAAGGGGLSGLFRGTYAQANAALIAGGGGGGGNEYAGTAGGGASGQARFKDNGGQPGTQGGGGAFAGGDCRSTCNGGALSGGNGTGGTRTGFGGFGGGGDGYGETGTNGGGGGGGYFGGGGGGSTGSTGNSGGGGGGSGYIGGVGVSEAQTLPGSGPNPPMSASPFYAPGLATAPPTQDGGTCTGHGRVVLLY